MFTFRKNGHFYEKIGKKGEPICIDDEIPFDIPESWEWYRLSVFTNIIMGQSPKGEFVLENGEGIEFHQGKIFFGDKFLNKSDKITIKPSKISPQNSILLCVRAPVGKINICDREICIGRGLASIKPFINDSFGYLYYFLSTQENIYKTKATGSTFKAIKKEIVENTLIPVPPLKEQERIVEKIEEIIQFVNEYGNYKEKLDRLNSEFPDKLKSSILQEAIQGKLVPQDPDEEPASVLLEKIREEKERLIKEKKIKRNNKESFIYKKNNHHFEKVGKNGEPICIDSEIPFDIPESWQWCKLEKIVKILGDGIHGTPDYDNDGEYYFINGNNLNNGEIVFKDNTKKVNHEEYLKHKRDLNESTVLVSINGTIGNVAFYIGEKVMVGKSACYFNLFDLHLFLILHF